MKILAFGASNSSQSINKKFAASVSKYYKEADDTIEVLDLNDFSTPIFSVDLERQVGLPQEALDFAAKIDEADFLIISLSENNGSYAAAYKNLIDWVSRIKGRKIFNNKPVFLLSTSPGARGGASVMEAALQVMPYQGAEILDSFSLPEFHKNFEEGKGVVDMLLRSQLEAKVRKSKRTLAEKANIVE